MEEKERYVIDYCDDIIFDTEKGYYPSGDTICKTLNRQDKQIKELEEYVKSKENCNEWLTMADNENLQKENQQLKQQLAEKDKDIKYYKESYYMIQDEKDHYAGQCLNLQDRIEELEKDNKRIRKNWNNSKTQQTRLYNNLKQQLLDLPKKIVTDFYDEIRHRAILEDDYCPDHNFERKYGVRKCLLENIKDTILKKYGGENE